MMVSFYMPRAYLPSGEECSAWLAGERPRLREEGKRATAEAWIYRTWLELCRFTCRTELVHEMPGAGCVVALSGTIPLDYQPPEGLFLVAVVADGSPHPAAHLQILQNPAHALRLRRSVFMPHWPQPGLVGRDAGRGGRFERAAFFGAGANLAPELRAPAWEKLLAKETGLEFELRGPEKWHDYSDVDAVIAIRSFRKGRQLRKPATKLYNAWLAGVPFIGGADSAYAHEGREDRNYLVAATPDQLLAHLRKLKCDDGLRAALVAEGKKRSMHYTDEAIAARWRKLVEETLPAAARRRAGRKRHANSFADTVMRAMYKLDAITMT